MLLTTSQQVCRVPRDMPVYQRFHVPVLIIREDKQDIGSLRSRRCSCARRKQCQQSGEVARQGQKSEHNEASSRESG